MDTNILSRVVYKLVVCTTEYLPVTREGGVRDKEVTSGIAISVSYFGVGNAGPVSGRELGVYMSIIHPKLAAWKSMKTHHTSITNS
jgi:hypothetical protein